MLTLTLALTLFGIQLLGFGNGVSDLRNIFRPNGYCKTSSKLMKSSLDSSIISRAAWSLLL